MKRIVVTCLILAIASFSVAAGQTSVDTQVQSFIIDCEEITDFFDLSSIKGGREAEETYDNGKYVPNYQAPSTPEKEAHNAEMASKIAGFLTELSAAEYQLLYDIVHSSLRTASQICVGVGACISYTANQLQGGEIYGTITVNSAKSAGVVLAVIGYLIDQADKGIPPPPQGRP